MSYLRNGKLSKYIGLAFSDSALFSFLGPTVWYIVKRRTVNTFFFLGGCGTVHTGMHVSRTLPLKSLLHNVINCTVILDIYKNKNKNKRS